MRIAVISDVHGNAFALQAVLEQLSAAAPDLIVNLGDQVEGGADPARAAALQAGLAAAGAAEVRGNNEEKLWPGGRRTPGSRAFGEWLGSQLDPLVQARLAALPLTLRLLGGRVLACHGTPQSAWDSLLWEWDAGGYYRARDPRALREAVEPLGAEVLVCGHTHRPGAARVADTLIVNAGAVSEQVDGDPRARWTLLEWGRGGWSVSFQAVPYDLTAAVAWARRHSPYGEAQAQMLLTGELGQRGD